MSEASEYIRRDDPAFVTLLKQAEAAVNYIDWLEAAHVELEAALRLALYTAESWIHDQLDGTRYLNDALAELQPCRDALEQKADKR